MKKPVLIAIIAAGAAAVFAAVVFLVIPGVTSNEAERQLKVTFAEAGIPDDMWKAGKVTYVPIVGNLVIEKLEIGNRNSDVYITAGKAVLSLKTNNDEYMAGSVEVQDVSFLSDEVGITAKNISINDFSIDKMLMEYSPAEAIGKLGSVRMSDAVFRLRGRRYVSLGSFSADINYTEGKLPAPSVTIKDLAMDVRQLMSIPDLRSEYRLSSFEMKNTFTAGVYASVLSMEMASLFALKTDVSIFLPSQLASGDIAAFARIDFEDDIKLNSFSVTYTDRSLLDHVFELAGMGGNRDYFADELYELIMMFAMMGGAELERFVNEATVFIAKPGTLELKTNIGRPLSFYELGQNPFAMNLSFTINGGKPFTASGFDYW